MSKLMNDDFSNYFVKDLGKVAQQALDVMKLRPSADEDSQNKSLAFNLYVFYSFYLSALGTKGKLSQEISNNIINTNLKHVKKITNDDELAQACKDTMMRVSGSKVADDYSKEFDYYNGEANKDRVQCYKDLDQIKPLK